MDELYDHLSIVESWLSGSLVTPELAVHVLKSGALLCHSLFGCHMVAITMAPESKQTSSAMEHQ